MMDITKPTMEDITIKDLQSSKLDSVIDFFKTYVSREFGENIRVIRVNPKTSYATLKQLEEVVNDCLHAKLGNDRYPEGIKTPSRKHDLIAYRQVFCYVAAECSYGCSETAVYLGIDHATVIHNKTKVDNLLRVKDLLISTVYTDVSTEMEKRYPELYKSHE